ncbi:MAG: archaemetzincin family Zn-dependent metalloprotease [Calditrichaeota bacterium]|nr:archaemetzincin family Zn-dependent metalloprotease [Calditrichota bacterium]
MIRSICLIPIEFAETKLLDSLIFYLSHTFHLQVEVRQKKIIVEEAFSRSRRQYNSSILLSQLIDDPPDSGDCKILGLCDFDLFIPIFTYVFGEAQLDGIGAIVSTNRLRNEFYGGRKNSALLSERLAKEATHELGHTFGLTHCSHPGCAMNFSTYVEDIDEKSAIFCRECEAVVRQKIGYDKTAFH